MASRLSFETTAARENRPAFILPPLILHPFADANGPNKLAESSRASLKLQGLLPQGEASREDLDRSLLDGRYSEMRMLYYVGKDLMRWIEQCLEFVAHNRAELPSGIAYQSFAALLIQGIGHRVSKLCRAADSGSARQYRSQAAEVGRGGLQVHLHARARITMPFRQRPGSGNSLRRLCAELLQIRRSDVLRQARERDFTPLATKDCGFELYSSGEYSRLLERAWAE